MTMQTRRSYVSAAKPAALVLLGMIVGSICFSDFFRPSSALAQDKVAPESLLNAAEQRKQINLNLVQIQDRLGRIEAQLKTGISVKVTEMPPVTMKDATKPADK